MTIGEIVENIVAQAKKPIVLSNGKSFDYFKTIDRIKCYLNSQYVDGGSDIFWNIVNSRVVHFAKNIDLDTKDLQPYAEGEINMMASWILRMKFSRWLEDNHLAIALNYRSMGLSSYGSWVWELIDVKKKKEVKSVPLDNLYFDYGVEKMEEAFLGEGVVRLFRLSQNEIESKNDVWSGTEKIEYEDGFTEIWEWNGQEDGQKKKIIGWGKGQEEIILYEKILKKCPFYDFHIDDFSGRWLRVGVVERLFPLQVLANKKVNYNDTAQEIASLLLMRTNNPETEGNVLTDLTNGDIINSNDLQQIGIDNRSFNSFVAELQQIETKADQLCMTPSIITGESTPSSIPFRSLAVMTNAGKSAFRLIKENIGEATGYLLKEEIFPSLVEQWNREELVEIAGCAEDIEEYDKTVKEKVKIDFLTEAKNKGVFVSKEDLVALEGRVQKEISKNGRAVNIGKNFFNFEFGIKTNITGEATDKQQRNDALWNILTMLQQSPQLNEVPYFRQYCEDNGISYWRLTKEQQDSLMAGGALKNIPAKQDSLMAQVDTE